MDFGISAKNKQSLRKFFNIRQRRKCRLWVIEEPLKRFSISFSTSIRNTLSANIVFSSTVKIKSSVRQIRLYRLNNP